MMHVALHIEESTSKLCIYLLTFDLVVFLRFELPPLRVGHPNAAVQVQACHLAQG